MEDHAVGTAHGGMGHAQEVSVGPWWALSQWDLLIGAVVLFVLGAYLFVVWRARGERSAPDLGAAFAFTLGLGVVFIGLSSPFVFLRMGSHLGYMLQLELLMSLSPPLLLLGLIPVMKVLPEGHSAYRLSRLIFVPALTLPVWLGVIYAWHVPPLHMMGMMGTHSQIVYPLQLLSYAGAGLLFWWPVVKFVDHSGGMGLLGKLGYLALAQMGAALLAALLIFYPQLIYNHGPITQPLGLSGMVDQKVSGIVMMVLDMSVASAVAGWVVLRELGRSTFSVDSRRLSPEVGDG